MSSSRFMKLFQQRHGVLLIAYGAFMVVSLATRAALLLKSASMAGFDMSLPVAFMWGFVFDAGAGLLMVAPAALLLAALPAGFFSWRIGRVAAHAGMVLFLALLVFGAVAEWLFWDEFSVRFNFIAVDYLIYTTEVVGNIRESYPMPWIAGGIAAAAVLLHLLIIRSGMMALWLRHPAGPARHRWLVAACWAGAAVLAGSALDSRFLPRFDNNYNSELAKNGLWSFFAAFRNNELEYDKFYATLPVDEAFRMLHKELNYDGSRYLGKDLHDTLRLVVNEGSELHLNVIQITVESLSAEFMEDASLTPCLNALARESLVFDNLYATGTRTDRGMEALALSLPPTPGRSLVKRPHNENLFTLGSVFRSRGYDTAFIYGGYGYFDNMNYFFGNNGYRIVDRASVSGDDITFANAWGACDEDLYRWTLREADAVHASGKPFHFFVMTTSNHRPFTYPGGRIDLPSKVSGRAGGVKYTDYAIGQFIREASARPWFKNTVFVIVADHCASVAGKVELPVQQYHIPMLIYAPGGQVAPGRIGDLMSQIDYAPTLLGLLNWTYVSRFYGWDVRKASGDRRALIGNYQKLGLYEPHALCVLRPLQGVNEYRFNQADFTLVSKLRPEEVEETIAYYQTASYLYRNKRFQALSPDEHMSYRTPGTAPGMLVR